jgi:hypothetical protein
MGRDFEAEGTRMVELNKELIAYLEHAHPKDETAKIMIQGLKDDIFQNWRKIVAPDDCWAMDIDIVDCRKRGRIAAVREQKEWPKGVPDNSIHMINLPTIAKSISVWQESECPLLFDQYKIDLRMAPEEVITEIGVGYLLEKGYMEFMTPEQYVEHLKEL